MLKINLKWRKAPQLDSLSIFGQITDTSNGARESMKKDKPEQIIYKIKKEVSEKVLAGNPLKKFPEEFLSRLRRSSLTTKEPATTRQASRVKREYEEILLPTGKIKLGNICKAYPICMVNGTVLFEVNSLEKAKFILCAKKKDQYIIKMPKSEIVIKRAVWAYETYLKEIRDKLIKAFIARGCGKTIAESLARQVFEKIDLPYIGSQ